MKSMMKIQPMGKTGSSKKKKALDRVKNLIRIRVSSIYIIACMCVRVYSYI